MQFLSGAQVFRSQTNMTRHKVKRMKYLQHMDTSTMMTSLKMDKTKKAPKKIHMNMSLHQTGRMIQVTTSSKNQDQNDQEDATIENDGPEKMIEYEDMEQPEEIETNQYDR